MPNAAAIYARISSDPSGMQLGVTRQIEDCLALATRRGWPVRTQYVDDDRSAYSGKPRPEYRQLLEDIRTGQVDAVVVWQLDRLHRQPRELEEFFDVCDASGVTALATVTGDVDLSTHDGRFMARILGAMARKESDDKSLRITRKHLELAESGEWAGGGTRPFGYLADRRSINPTEAATVREAVARVLAGDSLRALANDLNERAVPTVSGGPWSTAVLRRLLMSARISGQREHHGRIVGPAKWDAIVTPAETARVRMLFNDPARRLNRTARRYLLAGLLRCSLCGATLIARPRGDGTRRYVCAKVPGRPGCGKMAVLAEPIEQLIQEAVLYRLDTPTLAAAMRGEPAADQQAARLSAQLEADLAQLVQLADAYGNVQITFAEYLAARKPIEARLEAGKRAIARGSHLIPVADYVGDSSALRARWGTLPLSRQRAIVAALLDRATVAPAVRGRNTFDPERITPTWRV
jgi:site-specific DNA recombinase